MGFLDYVYNKPAFVILALFFKFICGIGMGANGTSAFSIIATHYSNEREKCLGSLEASVIIGILFGRVVGTFLY
jgi:MFS family permease